jgi:1-acyl-sn-glycerol-3-phosphate acyltransferase
VEQPGTKDLRVLQVTEIVILTTTMNTKVRASSSKSSLFIRVLKTLLSRLGKVTVSGVEYLDGQEGKVVVCNHIGWADPLWMGYSAMPHTLHQMAKKELFKNPVIGWLVRSGGGFPIDRGRPSAATIKQVISLVEQGKLVLVFPNGTRTRDQVEAKRGAATIALHARAQIIPAHYEGPEQIRFIHLLRRPAIRVTFGAPIVIPSDVPIDRQTALRLTTELDEAMNSLTWRSTGARL